MDVDSMIELNHVKFYMSFILRLDPKKSQEFLELIRKQETQKNFPKADQMGSLAWRFEL